MAGPQFSTNDPLPPAEYGGDQGPDEPPPRDEAGAEPRVRVPPAPPAVDVASLHSPVQAVPRVPPRAAAEARQPPSVVAAVGWKRKTFHDVSLAKKTHFLGEKDWLWSRHSFLLLFSVSFYFWMVTVIHLGSWCADAVPARAQVTNSF